jgi:hypothetical protein
VNSFAKWLAGQRVRRVVFIAILFPLFGLGIISAAIVLMVAQVKGPREALLDCLIALALLAGMALFSGLEVPLLLASAAVSWAIWIGLGTLLARTGSLALAAQVLVLAAIAGLVAFNLMIEDSIAYWSPLLEAFYTDLAGQGLEVTVDVEQQAGLMSGVLIAGSLTGALIVLLLGSSWASQVSGGNFGQQFRQLRLGYVIGGVAALAGIAGLFGLDFNGALLVFGAAFMFHGIAVVAWWSVSRGWPRGWWIGLLILPALLPELLVIEATLLSALGFVDNWYGLRRANA